MNIWHTKNFVLSAQLFFHQIVGQFVNNIENIIKYHNLLYYNKLWALSMIGTQVDIFISAVIQIKTKIKLWRCYHDTSKI